MISSNKPLSKREGFLNLVSSKLDPKKFLKYESDTSR